MARSSPVSRSGQIRVVGKQQLNRRAVGVQARADKPVDLGAVLGGAERPQACRDLLSTRSYRQAQRGDPAGVRRLRIRSGVQEGFDRGERRAGDGVGQLIAGRVRHPASGGCEGVEHQPGRTRVVVEHRRPHRPGAGHPGAVRQQQAQAPQVAVSGGLDDGLAWVGMRAGIEEQLGDGRVVDLDRSLEGRAVARLSPVVGVRVGPGREQQAHRLGQPGRAVGVNLVPAGVAGVQQRRPAALIIEGQRRPRVAGEVLAHRRGVPEHGRGGQAAPGDTRIGVQDLPGVPHPALDRGGQELRERPAGCGVGFERGDEPRPAGKA